MGSQSPAEDVGGGWCSPSSSEQEGGAAGWPKDPKTHRAEGSGGSGGWGGEQGTTAQLGLGDCRKRCRARW